MELMASPAQSCSGAKQVTMLAANAAEIRGAVTPYAGPWRVPNNAAVGNT